MSASFAFDNFDIAGRSKPELHLQHLEVMNAEQAEHLAGFVFYFLDHLNV